MHMSRSPLTWNLSYGRDVEVGGSPLTMKPSTSEGHGFTKQHRKMVRCSGGTERGSRVIRKDRSEEVTFLSET